MIKEASETNNSEKNIENVKKFSTQEAHGPHRSPEETVQFKSINTYDYIMTLIKRRKNKNIINFMRIYWFFI